MLCYSVGEGQLNVSCFSEAFSACLTLVMTKLQDEKIKTDERLLDSINSTIF